MKYQFITFILIGFLFASCSSVKQHNKNIYALRSEKELQKDVDYLHKKLQKLHPKLDWYISKQELDYKFDSLKYTITSPMTGNEFYRKISPLLASVRQGHNNMSPLVEKVSPKEVKTYKKKGENPLSQFEYALFDDKLYIVKNNSADTSIHVGSEVVAINGITPQEIYQNYRHTTTSDGYNETFYPQRFAGYFGTHYQLYIGKTLLDSAFYQLKYNDTLETYWVCRTKKDTTDVANRPKTTASTTGKRGLTYLEADSSIALMTIPAFSATSYSTFYKKSFEQLRAANTQTLIIDLRNNLGGSLNNVQTLYTYLTDTSFYFTSKAEVTSRTSLHQLNTFKNSKIGTKILAPILYSVNLIRIAKIKQEDGKYYLNLKSTKITPHKPSYFKGDVYVLINGMSSSASSILSSNLHGSKRATFVGEETGGAYNGGVAGRFYLFTLPKSKLKGRFGLMAIQPFYQTDTEGRGIMPDIEVSPTLEDKINGNDPGLNTILELVRSKRIQNYIITN